MASENLLRLLIILMNNYSSANVMRGFISVIEFIVFGSGLIPGYTKDAQFAAGFI